LAHAAAVGVLTCSATLAHAQDALVFGVFPNLTARQIVEGYRPLAAFLEKRLQRPVTLVSARDFKTFVERTRQGDYDLVLTAPHLAWLANNDAGYRPLLKYAQPVRGLLVVRADAPFDRPLALRRRTIATADSIAVAVLALQSQLAAQGLRASTDYRTSDSGSHLNAVMQVVNGRADAAMLGLHPYNLMPPELRRQLRVLAQTPPLSGLVYLAHPRLADADASAMRNALLAFAATAEGRAHIRKGGYGGFSAVDDKVLQALRPYALQAQEMLRETP
jgi:phosphonate transport system substrate-binding protein